MMQTTDKTDKTLNEQVADRPTRATNESPGAPLYFSRWLKNQRKRNDPVGDLARDAALDSGFPETAVTLAAYTRHLDRVGSCKGAQEALKRAWGEWQKETAA